MPIMLIFSLYKIIASLIINRQQIIIASHCSDYMCQGKINKKAGIIEISNDLFVVIDDGKIEGHVISIEYHISEFISNQMFFH